MPFIVVYDANVLYPSTLRDLLIRVAQAGLPDPGDRHVLAAAIKARAQVVVTQNLRDFPKAAT
jgi:hypothetical protein